MGLGRAQERITHLYRNPVFILGILKWEKNKNKKDTKNYKGQGIS